MALSRGTMQRFWKIVNPVVLVFAGFAPWWLVLETTGRVSGRPRRFPLARGPIDNNVFWLVAVHGREAGLVRNIAKHDAVRIRHRGRWRRGTATIEPMDDAMLGRFNGYGRFATRVAAIEPVLLKITTTS